MGDLGLRLVYGANILVAGAVGIASLIGGPAMLRAVWQADVDPAGMPVRVVGAFWCTIALLSAGGLVWPRSFALVLVVQLAYKGTWLLAMALPAFVRGRADSLPSGITAFFLAWVVILPFVIPWGALLREAS